METVRQERRLPQIVDQELRSDLNAIYKLWRERNPDGDMIDWLMELPASMYWVVGHDITPEARQAWLDFWNWFTEQNRLVAEADEEGAEADE